MDLITVIVPIYNVEKYLEKCLTSIICQTYRNLEIILVNDGSTDSSLEICCRYKKNDDRIAIINQKNNGVSNARNSGIKIATGRHITFIDADDYVENEYIEFLYDLLKNNHADISICGANKRDKDGNITSESIECNMVMNAESAIQELLHEKYFFCVCWAKLYSKKLFKDIGFNERLKIGEDLDLLYRLFDNCKKVVIENKPLYNSLDRTDSASKAVFNDDWRNEIKLSQKIIEFVALKYPQINDYAIKRYFRINMTCIVNILKKNFDDSLILELLSNLNRYQKKILLNKYISINFKLWYLACFINPAILKIYLNFKYN